MLTSDSRRDGFYIGIVTYRFVCMTFYLVGLTIEFSLIGVEVLAFVKLKCLCWNLEGVNS